MIRLNPIAEPTWVDMTKGLRLKVLPVGHYVMRSAAAAPEVRRCIDGGFGPEAVFTANAVAIARMVVVEWEGVGDAEGEPLPVTPAHVEALLVQEPDVLAAFKAKVLVPALTLVAEKKASAPLPSGTSAGAPITARPARSRARTARS